MPAPAAKIPGNLIRICREKDGSPILEYGWTLIRFEPDSGNAVAEFDGKRIVYPRHDFDCLNFPGSDAVWEIIAEESGSSDFERARASWTKLDLRGVITALLTHARKLDPSFAGVQTIADLREKMKETHDSCSHQIDILRIEMRRAEDEYNRCPTRTGFDNDQKDTLLSRWHNLEDRYAAKKYYCEKLLPAWQKILDALENLSITTEKMR